MRKPALAAIVDEKLDLKIIVDAAVCFEVVSGRCVYRELRPY
jgi:hypothetical protein